MHESSFEKFRAFRNAYLEGPGWVLEVGSGADAGSLVLRQLFPPPFEFVGLDIAAGHNVDLVPPEPYRWAELDSESFDVVLSNQTFEHVPYFWVSAAEIARVLRPGGLACVVAPSSGFPHRFPLDCWRFYPDSWVAICAYVGLELVESFREKPARRSIPGIYWRDSMMVARKPPLADEVIRKAFYDRIDAIVATRTDAPAPASGDGPAAALYRHAHGLDSRRLPPWENWPGVRQVRQKADRRRAQSVLAKGESALPWPPR